jgi:hypothetical protein
VPTIHEYAGHRTNDREGRHKRDQHHGGLGGGALQSESDDGDYREDRQEVPENTDKLRNPQPPYRANPQHFTTRERYP